MSDSRVSSDSSVLAPVTFRDEDRRSAVTVRGEDRERSSSDAKPRLGNRIRNRLKRSKSAELAEANTVKSLPDVTAGQVAAAKVIAYHPTNNEASDRPDAIPLRPRRSSAIEENYDCNTADVVEVPIKEPYEFWKKASFINVLSGFKTGYFVHRGEKKLLPYLMDEVLLGVCVVFAQIPETISFSMIAGMDPAMGLHGAWMIGLISTLLGGRPGMICGCTGSISTITGAMIANTTQPHLTFPIIITAGCFMIIFSFFNLSFIIRFISKNVMMGFCNGLAIIIAKSQLHMFTNAHHEYVSGEIALHMSIMCVLSMFAFQFWPKVPKISRVVPPAMVALLVTIAYEQGIVKAWRGIATTTVGDIGTITPEFQWPRPFWTYPAPYVGSYNSADISNIISYGTSFFLVMCIESLMTISAMDAAYDNISSGDQSIFAIGVANVTSGLFGGLGGNTMIGLSNLVAKSGGGGKEAPIVVAFIVFISTAFLTEYINNFPTAGLAGIMFIVAGHTFVFDSIKMVICSFLPEKFLQKNTTYAHAIPLMDAIITVAVTLMVPLMGLDIGILVGVVISSFYFVDKIFRQMRVFKHVAEREGIGMVAVYDIFGPLFFSSSAALHKAFDFENDPDVVILRMTNSSLMDYTAMETMSTLRQSYEAQGKRLIIKNLKKDCESKILKSQARMVWDMDRDHETREIDIPNLVTFVNEMPDLPGLSGHKKKKKEGKDEKPNIAHVETVWEANSMEEGRKSDESSSSENGRFVDESSSSEKEVRADMTSARIV